MSERQNSTAESPVGGLPPFPPAAVSPPAVSAITKAAVSALFAIAVLVATVEAIRAVGSDPARPEIVDFHPFYLAATTVWQGHFAQSYDLRFMQDLQRSFGGGKDVFMPFVYPPLFGLLMAPLALLPVGLAFPLFTLGTFAFYLVVMRRLAGAWFWHAVLAVSPVLLIDIRIGQNGFLTAGLAGLAAELTVTGTATRAGLAAGALVFKPQMATMLPILFVLRRDWRALGIAGLTAALLTGSAVLILGRDTVPAFLSSASQMATFVASGTVPLHRMTSAYACLLSLGASARLALIIHGLVAFSVVTAASVTAHRLTRSSTASSDARSAAGVMLMATVFVSPYIFDYDLTIFGAGLALALPGMARRISPSGLVTILIGVGVAGALDLVTNMLIDRGAMAALSIEGPALLVCFGTILGLLSGADTVRRASPRSVRASAARGRRFPRAPGEGRAARP